MEGLSATPHPKSSAQLWPKKQETDWERKLGVGWRVGGKKFKEGRLGGIAPPPNQSLRRGGFRRSEKAREDGVILRAERDTRATPRKAGGLASWAPGPGGQRGALRTERPRGSPEAEPSLTCRPLGCLLFPPWHRSTSLQSHFWRPSPSRARGPRSRSPAGSPPPPARWLLGRLGLCPPDDPPCNSSTAGQRPPSWVADTDGLCRLV